VFIDSHCHLEMDEYDKDREAVIKRAADQGVECMVTVATEEAHFDRALRIAEQNRNVYAALGIHPHNAKGYSQELQDRIIALAKHPKVVAYGEIGLDFFKDYSPRQAQTEAFAAQISAACTAGLPIVIHSRNAKEETLEILKGSNLGETRVIIHCFSYDLATAKTMLDMGFYLSITGVITYKNSSLADIVRHLPLESLLAETDSPFLTPHPRRGKRNEPAEVALVYEKIAEVQRRPMRDVSETIGKTFGRLFLSKTQ
jgi:TatD DNase family protein